MDTDTAHRIKNYVFGTLGVSMSLADLTGYLQFIAALAGAILVCRQLWHDFRKGKKNETSKS